MRFSLVDLVAANVRAEMAYQKRQVSELSKVLQIGPESTSRKINGHVAFTISDLGRISEWLNCPVANFFLPRFDV